MKLRNQSKNELKEFISEANRNKQYEKNTTKKGKPCRQLTNPFSDKIKCNKS